ncbi:hypothetical protein H9L39_14929 [Fusarium oxysporum f. sp. albedinis]|nr:hypothetical protein H9L39_14929 [Fusarium oxysporum f. sp. albedinis]
MDLILQVAVLNYTFEIKARGHVDSWAIFPSALQLQPFNQFYLVSCVSEISHGLLYRYKTQDKHGTRDQHGPQDLQQQRDQVRHHKSSHLTPQRIDLLLWGQRYAGFVTGTSPIESHQDEER